MTAIEDFEAHLRRFPSLPLLFVGSGLSRRYLGLPTWEGLLRELSGFTNRNYQYFRTHGNSDYPRIATALAEEFHSIWFDDPRFQESRNKHLETVANRDSPFKIEVSRLVSASQLPEADESDLAAEIELFRRAVIDGVITTNYDTLLEQIFPDFQTYVGQNELLFSDPTGVGEIYKIHGCTKQPESLVITHADYENFNERNPYLAAKLLTLFVEHPTIFLGYSLSDQNVRELFSSIANVLTSDNIQKLQDRLIFVVFERDAQATTFERDYLPLGSFNIPIHSMRVPNFLEIFEVLTRLTRVFPARLLRQLKERVYSLVLKNEPNGRLFVTDINDETNIEDIEVVFGIGIQDKLSDHGYVGLDRRALLLDCVKQASEFDPIRIVSETLPVVVRPQKNIPIYRYLRAGGYLNEDGTLREDREVSQHIIGRFNNSVEKMRTVTSQRGRAARLINNAGANLERLIEQNTVPDVLISASMLPNEEMDLERLREFLEANSGMCEGQDSSNWSKLVCYYDYLAFRSAPVAH